MRKDQLTMEQLKDWKRRFDMLTFMEQVMESRQMSIGERMALGPRLFDLECEQTRQEIRVHHPEFTSEQVEAELHRCLAEQRKIDEEGIYRDAGMIGEND